MKKRIKEGIISIIKFFIKIEVIFIIFKIIIIAYLFSSDMPIEKIAIISIGIGGSLWLIIQLKNRIEKRHRFRSLPDPIHN